MSAENQILFGERSDIPDLLKSLADYSFSLPAFDDIGEHFLISTLLRLSEQKARKTLCAALVIMFGY